MRNSRYVEQDVLRLSSAGVMSRTSAGEVPFSGFPGLAFDYVVTVAIEEEPTPRAVVSEVTIRQKPGGAPITGRAVASELGGVREAAISHRTVTAWWSGDGGADPVASAGRRARKGESHGPAVVASALTDLHLAADAYRAAQAAGRPTTAGVAAALQCSPSTARKRVMAARRSGLLPSAGGTTRPKL